MNFLRQAKSLRAGGLPRAAATTATTSPRRLTLAAAVTSPVCRLRIRHAGDTPTAWKSRWLQRIAGNNGSVSHSWQKRRRLANNEDNRE
jgi:hypothetical protein